MPCTGALSMIDSPAPPFARLRWYAIRSSLMYSPENYVACAVLTTPFGFGISTEPVRTGDNPPSNLYVPRFSHGEDSRHRGHHATDRLDVIPPSTVMTVPVV
ncbi:hypothetical protein AWB81_06993 [Caballeronia arationis]|uniref:Uncharacterized protein n=1 Tax=Caballeronia arationis TaxID=1777142 RepID=A0A7Z7N1G3_9BURK|nr:hypothetical protein AWB81_06993 [Caballeronia arationis]SOE55097.1 hypothetical protein SAMN05446927_0954 [Caballeronia arationis]